MRTKVTGVRYNPDTEIFELRCDDCVAKKIGSSYWPLTHEFWNVHRGMTRCRSCQKDYTARFEREKRHNDPEYKKRCLDTVKEIRKVKGHIYQERQTAKKRAERMIA
jgi:hypothetical protein